MVFWLILLAVVAASTAFPLICGFWPIGVVTLIILSVIAFGLAWRADDQGEEGLTTLLTSFLVILIMWLGMGLAGIISIFI